MSESGNDAGPRGHTIAASAFVGSRTRMLRVGNIPILF